MLTVNEDDLILSRNISIRFDETNAIYYCFYHGNENVFMDVIFSYQVRNQKWIVETKEYENLLEKRLHQLLEETNLSFDEQVQSINDYLDAHFAHQAQEKKSKSNLSISSFPWLQGIHKIRRWASEDVLSPQSPVSQRHSAPAKSTDQIDDSRRNRTETSASLLDHPYQNRFLNRPPSIKEIWLNVSTDRMDEFRKKLGSRKSEEKLKKIAEKFVTYFGGTFQCDVGQEYQLDHNLQKWHFVVLKVEFLSTESAKSPKTKIIFIIDSLPHYVRS